MHVTELTQELIAELKEYVEINSEGHILTKKNNNFYVENHEDHPVKRFRGKKMLVGDSKTKIGKRRGSKTKYGQNFAFTFPETKERITCKAREIVWIFNNGAYDPKMKVKPKNGDLFDDRIENLHLVKNNNGRPAGKKDKVKRQKRDTLSAKQEQEVKNLRKSGLTYSQIAEALETTHSVVRETVKRFIKRNQIKSFFNTATLKGEVTKDGCQIGVYVLCASSLDAKNFLSKGYIGSSRMTWARIQSHFNDLEKNKHYNTEMQAAYNSGNYKFNAFWLERGEFEHGEALALETEHINRYERASLFNKWSQPSLEEIQPYLDKYKHYLDDESRYTVDDNGCWNWNRTDSGGYPKEIQGSIDGKLKHIKPHRLSYYKTYGEYPELIRHMCDNKACVNPECLKKGSHQQNGLDKTREFRKQFEYWWLRYRGDGVKLTEHFGWKPKSNTPWATAVYTWERKLDLRSKYADIFIQRADEKRSRKMYRTISDNLIKKLQDKI